MRELEKILKEIDNRFENVLIIDDECRKTALSRHDYEKAKYFRTGIIFTERAKYIVEDIIRKHMNDGWISVDERMPTQEECEDNWFWIAYGDSFGNSPRIAKCEWVFADDEDGNDDSGPEFYIDQFPFPYKPSKNLIKAWKIIDIPSPYRPERNE